MDTCQDNASIQYFIWCKRKKRYNIIIYVVLLALKAYRPFSRIAKSNLPKCKSVSPSLPLFFSSYLPHKLLLHHRLYFWLSSIILWIFNNGTPLSYSTAWRYPTLISLKVFWFFETCFFVYMTACIIFFSVLFYRMQYGTHLTYWMTCIYHLEGICFALKRVKKTSSIEKSSYG